jgi:formylglycine-generating enzyme
VTAPARTARGLLALHAALSLVGCERSNSDSTAEAGPSAAASVHPAPRRPAVLYLPDGGDAVLGADGEARPSGAPLGSGRCAPEMVDVAGRFCIDRFEATLVDARLGRPISPYFAPSRAEALGALRMFEDRRPAGAPPFPLLPPWQREEPFAVRADSKQGVVPNGYVSGLAAAKACEAASKRLCSLTEWQEACRGEQRRKFPYGEQYEAGACNVAREAHPAHVLYGDASIHHLDPRLNLVEGTEGPLLRRTGATPRCKSDWAGDAAYDLVGNLDEWVAEPSGMFAGGFYARATVEGCDARISQHPPEYYDYSVGVRCCRSSQMW